MEHLDDEAIVFDPQLEATHKLNRVAYVIWQRCDGRSTTRQLATDLSHTFNVDFELALDDVEQTILSFAERQLVYGMYC